MLRKSELYRAVLLATTDFVACAERQDESGGQAVQICRDEGAAGLEVLCSASVGVSGECFESDSDCCAEFAAMALNTEEYYCVMNALREREVGALGLRVSYSERAEQLDVIAILGNDEVEVTRLLQQSVQSPGVIETARVRLKNPDFYDTCLQVGMPDVDPCLAARCLRDWFEPGTCTDELVCLEPLEYEGGGLLCP